MSDERRRPGPAQVSEPPIPAGAVRPRAVVALPLLPPEGSPERRVPRRKPLPVLGAASDPDEGPGAVRTPQDATAEDSLERKVARGLRYTHFRANTNTTELLDVASSVGAVIELLEERGLLGRAELDRRKAALRQALAARFSGQGMGTTWWSDDADKYAVEGVRIDCEDRVHLCRAACCKLRFALSRQDVEEGIVRWDFSRPYQVAQGPDLYCEHLDRQQLCCSVHAHRPTACRSYDCRGDTRIWLDFERRVVNPRIYETGWPNVLSAMPGPVEEAATAAASAADVAPVPEPGVVAALARAIQRVPWRPVLFHLRGGSLVLTRYGTWLGTTLGLAVFYALHTAGRRLGAAPPAELVLGTVLSALVGARAIFAVQRRVAARLGEREVASRGSSVNGGLLGGLLFAIAYYREDPAGLLRLMDWAAPAFALGSAVGKIGCLGSGCCVGRPTASRLAVRYTQPLTKAVALYRLDGVPLVPVQLYEALVGLGLFVGLTLLPSALYGTGVVCGVLVLGFALGRALLRGYRYRFPGERASGRVAGAVHLGLLGIGVLLASGTVAAWVPGAGGVPASAPVSPGWSVALALSAGALAAGLYGIERQDGSESGPPHKKPS